MEKEGCGVLTGGGWWVGCGCMTHAVVTDISSHNSKTMYRAHNINIMLVCFGSIFMDIFFQHSLLMKKHQKYSFSSVHLEKITPKS